MAGQHAASVVNCNQALWLLKAITNYALTRDLIDRDPAAGHKPMKRKRPPHQPILEAEEYQPLLDAVTASASHARFASLLIIHIGCRCADACRIEV